MHSDVPTTLSAFTSHPPSSHSSTVLAVIILVLFAFDVATVVGTFVLLCLLVRDFVVDTWNRPSKG